MQWWRVSGSFYGGEGGMTLVASLFRLSDSYEYTRRFSFLANPSCLQQKTGTNLSHQDSTAG